MYVYVFSIAIKYAVGSSSCHSGNHASLIAVGRSPSFPGYSVWRRIMHGTIPPDVIASSSSICNAGLTSPLRTQPSVKHPCIAGRNFVSGAYKAISLSVLVSSIRQLVHIEWKNSFLFVFCLQLEGHCYEIEGFTKSTGGIYLYL